MPPRRRLNLFAFPPETDALFGMLIITSISLSLFLGHALALFFGFVESFSTIYRIGLETTRASLPIVGFSGIAVLTVLVVAMILYLRHPHEIRRRRKINAVSGKDLAIQEQINELALRSGVRPPTVELPPQGLRGTDAQAFGVGQVRSIALDGGLRILRKTKPDIFNALIHHELAHFANQDIGKSYFSDALWKSIRWVIILPFVLWLLANITIGLYLGLVGGDLPQRLAGPVQSVFILIVQFVFVLLMAGWMWIRLLRTREYYADGKAVLWGSRRGLNEIFLEEAQKEKPNTGFKIFQFHPDARERLDALQQPDILFKVSPLIIFLAGMLLSLLFVGSYFSFAAFLAFAGIVQAIRDASTGLVYWLARGILWFGIAAFFLFAFAVTGWLVNGVLLPRIQKEAVLDLIHGQRGWIAYMKMLIIAVIFVVGLEMGFFTLPFGILTPNDLWGFMFEILIITPMMVLLAWWYLVYIRFISIRLIATQVGNEFSVLRKRFVQAASAIWVLLFFIPGLFLSRFLGGELLEVFVYSVVIWLLFTIVCSLAMFAGSWVFIKLFFDHQPKKCPHCGKITRHSIPAIESCEHCEGVLGEWLFVPEQI